MNKIDYNKLMKQELKEIKEGSLKPTLLLHACCAPCASTAIERLCDIFDLTVYFYNPNMDSESEYKKRAEELSRFCLEKGVQCIISPYVSDEFYSSVKGMEEFPEGGSRCFICYSLRLERTAKEARGKGFDYFATTLTLSPLKNAEKLNQIGLELGEKYQVKYLVSDFKKEGGYLKSISLSKEYGLYRQNYCGCVYSKRLQP